MKRLLMVSVVLFSMFYLVACGLQEPTPEPAATITKTVSRITDISWSEFQAEEGVVIFMREDGTTIGMEIKESVEENGSIFEAIVDGQRVCMIDKREGHNGVSKPSNQTGIICEIDGQIRVENGWKAIGAGNSIDIFQVEASHFPITNDLMPIITAGGNKISFSFAHVGDSDITTQFVNGEEACVLEEQTVDGHIFTIHGSANGFTCREYNGQYGVVMLKSVTHLAENFYLDR